MPRPVTSTSTNLIVTSGGFQGREDGYTDVQFAADLRKAGPKLDEMIREASAEHERGETEEWS